jgi:hypothetical protein
MNLHKSNGILHYRKEGTSLGVSVSVDQGISEFYRSLIPKYLPSNRQKYPAHITVVRIHKEKPKNMGSWGKYEGKKINFQYSSYVHDGSVYWWLNAFSVELEEIRRELGLPVTSEYTRPPEGFIKCFHITLSNKK